MVRDPDAAGLPPEVEVVRGDLTVPETLDRCLQDISDRPQSLTQAEQVHTIGRAIGRSLRVEEMSPDEARSELLPILGSSTVVNMLLNAWAAAIGQPAFVTSTCAELTGAPPRTFLEWATDHAAEFRA